MLASLGATVTTADAGARGGEALPPEVWAVELRAAAQGLDLQKLVQLRERGLNAVVLNSAGLTARRLAQLRTRAARAGLMVIATCHAAAGKKPCAVKPRTRKSALPVADRSRKGLIVVRVAGPGKVRSLMRTEGRVLALARLSGNRQLDAQLWRDAISAAADSPTLDLGIAPTGGPQASAVDSYASLLAGREDTKPPSIPSKLTTRLASQTGITLGWKASVDNRGVAGYGAYLDGAYVRSTASLDHAFTGLACSRTYGLSVDAFDAAGTRSARASLSGTTFVCSAPPPPQPPPPPPPPQPPPPPPPPPGHGSELPAPLAASTGQTFYVATNGSDSSPGTLAQPWSTVQRALNLLTPGQRALVRGGTYAEGLDMTRAGTAAAPITVENYPGERPIVNGGGGRPLQVGSTGAYFRIKGFVFENSPYDSGGNVDIYGHHLEISGNEIRNGQDQGVYSDEQSHHAQVLGNWIHSAASS